MHTAGLRGGLLLPATVLVAEAATPAASTTVIQIAGHECPFRDDIVPPGALTDAYQPGLAGFAQLGEFFIHLGLSAPSW